MTTRAIAASPDRVGRLFKGLAIGGLSLAALGLVVSPERAWPGMLLAAWYVLGLGLGAAVFVALHHVTKASWGVVLRRIPEALMTATFPGVLLMALVLLLGAGWLYPWAQPGYAEEHHLTPSIIAWWQAPAFQWRAAVALAVMLLVTWRMLRVSARVNREGGLPAAEQAIRVSAVSLVLLGLSISFASFEWLMPLQAAWISTIFGVYNFAGMFLGAAALVTVVTIILRRAGLFGHSVGPAQLHDLGKFLFAFATFWAYIWFCQFMLIWYANIAEEAPYYLLRHSGGWLVLSVAMLVLNWGLPFLGLMSARAKKNEAWLLRVAVAVLIGQWLDRYVMILPPLRPEGPALNLWELAPTVGAAGLLGLLMLRHLSRGPLIPLRDPLLSESLHAGHSHGQGAAPRVTHLPTLGELGGAGQAPRTERTIRAWNVEDPSFWETTGRAVAYRNLCISIPALLLSFAVWMVWSVVVVNLPNIGFAFSTEQLFWLTALPGLSGATLRIFYSFTVPIFGGRNWTALSTASLLLPCIGMGMVVQDAATPYWMFVVLALLCGFGGGNFASSMANISFFFPKAAKGTALGLNAGLGNLGVSAVQFVVPMVIGAAYLGPWAGGGQTWSKGEITQPMWLQNAALFWVPLILACTVAAWFGMNNLSTASASLRDQMVIFRRKHNWIMCWLYIGTFGSFIGFSAGLPMLIKSQFPEVDPLKYAFLGPLVGALVRPIGGWLSDRIGGARVTLWNFVAMAAAAVAVIPCLQAQFFPGFLALFLVLFMTTGIGNGSTFRMIPVIFLNQRQREAERRGDDGAEAVRLGARESAAVLGFSSAVGAYGAFLVPNSFGWSIGATGGAAAAIWSFVAFYVTCIGITWWYYARRKAEAPC